MENQISCANCGEIFTPTGASVKLPWFCDECTKAAEFQEKIAPEPKPIVFEPEHVCGDGCTDAGCDSASVEATTQLIEALEAQVKSLTDATDSLSEMIAADNKVIEDLKSQLDESVTKNIDLDDTVNRLVKANIELRIENQYVLNAKQRAVEGLDRLHVEVAKFKSWTKDLIDTLVRDLKRETEAKDYYSKQQAREHARYRDEMHANIMLKARGFWARVFNLD